MRQFLHDPSIPAWINALTVVVLAGITWWYARIAKRQAAAAESQANASLKQAETAERQLAILQAQIQEHAGIASMKLKANIEELQQIANSWLHRMTEWGKLTPQSGTSILPQEWSVVIEHARSKSPELFEELLALRRACIDVSLMIDQFSSTRETYRNDSVAKTIQNKLSDISERCRSILAKL